MLRLICGAALLHTGNAATDEAWARANQLAQAIPVVAREELYVPEGTALDFYGAGAYHLLRAYASHAV